MKKQPDISIIIVNYKTKDLTEAALMSLERSRGDKDNWEVFIVDNNSGDESPKWLTAYGKRQKVFGKCEVTLSRENLGFAKANNIGIRNSRGRYILLLNSDTEVNADTIPTMIEFMDKNSKVGASTCALMLVDGSMDPACHRGFPTPWASVTYMAGLERLFPKSPLFSQYHQGYKDVNSIHDVDCISGAFFLVRREVVDTVGGLDEDYFMYAEDIDWAYRMREAGWRIAFNPTVTTLHRKKQSGRAHLLHKRRLTTEIYFHTYNWLFYKKHYQQRYGFLTTFAVNSFYGLRLFLLNRVGI